MKVNWKLYLLSGSLILLIVASSQFAYQFNQSKRLGVWRLDTKHEASINGRILKNSTFQNKNNENVTLFVASGFEWTEDKWIESIDNELPFLIYWEDKEIVLKSKNVFKRDDTSIIIDHHSSNGWMWYEGIIFFDPKIEWSEDSVEFNGAIDRRIRVYKKL